MSGLSRRPAATYPKMTGWRRRRNREAAREGGNKNHGNIAEDVHFPFNFLVMREQQPKKWLQLVRLFSE